MVDNKDVLLLLLLLLDYFHSIYHTTIFLSFLVSFFLKINRTKLTLNSQLYKKYFKSISLNTFTVECI